MDVKKIWGNLAIDSIDRTFKFYSALGFKPNNPHSSAELTSFSFGDDDFVINFFLRDFLREAWKGEITDAQASTEIMFTLGASSIEKVDAWADEVVAAGGTLLSQPEAFGKGYYGFVFADPDGHRFNVFYMEGME